MSKIGSNQNLGKKFNIFCTNLSNSEIRRYNSTTYNGKQLKLPSNALIISSPLNTDGSDTEQPSMLMTDSDSNVLTLTYSFSNEHFSFNPLSNTVYVKEYDSTTQQLKNKVANLENMVEILKKKVFEDDTTNVTSSIRLSASNTCYIYGNYGDYTLYKEEIQPAGKEYISNLGSNSTGTIVRIDAKDNDILEFAYIINVITNTIVTRTIPYTWDGEANYKIVFSRKQIETTPPPSISVTLSASESCYMYGNICGQEYNREYLNKNVPRTFIGTSVNSHINNIKATKQTYEYLGIVDKTTGTFMTDDLPFMFTGQGNYNILIGTPTTTTTTTPAPQKYILTVYSDHACHFQATSDGISITEYDMLNNNDSVQIENIVSGAYINKPTTDSKDYIFSYYWDVDKNERFNVDDDNRLTFSDVTSNINVKFAWDGVIVTPTTTTFAPKSVTLYSDITCNFENSQLGNTSGQFTLWGQQLQNFANIRENDFITIPKPSSQEFYDYEFVGFFNKNGESISYDKTEGKLTFGEMTGEIYIECRFKRTSDYITKLKIVSPLTCEFDYTIKTLQNNVIEKKDVLCNTINPINLNDVSTRKEASFLSVPRLIQSDSLMFSYYWYTDINNSDNCGELISNGTYWYLDHITGEEIEINAVYEEKPVVLYHIDAYSAHKCSFRASNGRETDIEYNISNDNGQIRLDNVISGAYINEPIADDKSYMFTYYWDIDNQNKFDTNENNTLLFTDITSDMKVDFIWKTITTTTTTTTTTTKPPTRIIDLTVKVHDKLHACLPVDVYSTQNGYVKDTVHIGYIDNKVKTFRDTAVIVDKSQIGLPYVFDDNKDKYKFTYFFDVKNEQILYVDEDWFSLSKLQETKNDIATLECVFNEVTTTPNPSTPNPSTPEPTSTINP